MAVACKDSSDVRTLDITIGSDGCTPTSFGVDPGREARLTIDNDSDSVHVIRDADGRIEEISVEAGESVEAFFDVPENDAAYTLVCEGEGGAASEITLIAGTGIASGATSEAALGTPGTQSIRDGALAVTLLDFEVSTSAETVTPGRYTIIGTNVSSASTHELNILQFQSDGDLVRVAGIEQIAPQQGGAVVVALEPGTYRLACQIVPGEFGSTVDHYQQGMWFDVLVLPEE